MPFCFTFILPSFFWTTWSTTPVSISLISSFMRLSFVSSRNGIIVIKEKCYSIIIVLFSNIYNNIVREPQYILSISFVQTLIVTWYRSKILRNTFQLVCLFSFSKPSIYIYIYIFFFFFSIFLSCLPCFANGATNVGLGYT